MINVSLFASAIRIKLWPDLMKSLESTSCTYEIFFAGNAKGVDDSIWAEKLDNPFYVRTGNIKPAQCYEIARRNCIGEVVVWIADDCEFKGNVIGKAYDYWKAQGNEKLILSLQTDESGTWQNMDHHRFFGARLDSPLMAPIGMTSRKFLDDLGGFDRRYTCGQYENDLVMRAYQAGGKVEIFGNRESYVEINHIEKSILAGEIGDKQDFEKRPFATGYVCDRFILEKSWSKMNEAKLFYQLSLNPEFVYNKDYIDMRDERTDAFEPYSQDLSYSKSESHHGWWD